MTISYKEERRKRLLDPEIKREVDALGNEVAIIQALIDARRKQNFTQKELSARSGIDQADISRIENGTANPTLDTLERLAEGLGMRLVLQFVPKTR